VKEFRCKFCHRLLAKVDKAKKVEIKCPKCKSISLYSDDQVFIVELDEAYLQKKIMKGKISFGYVQN
jgi:phage FluMu protein Com